MIDLALVRLEVVLGALAVVSGAFMLSTMVLRQRRSRRARHNVRPRAPVLNIRHAELMTSRSERFVAPLLDGFASAAHKLIRPAFVERSRELLDTAGPRRFLDARRLIAVKMLLAIVGAAIGFAIGQRGSADVQLLATLATPFLGWHLPDLYVKRLSAARAEEITRELPDLLDQVTISVGAGLGFEAALARVCQGSRTALTSEFSRTLHDIQVGVDRVVAYRGLSLRVESEDLNAVATSLMQSIEMGTPLGPVLNARATELRRKRRSHADEMAQKLSVKLTLPTAFCILPSLMVVIMGPTILQVMESGFGG